MIVITLVITRFVVTIVYDRTLIMRKEMREQMFKKFDEADCYDEDKSVYEQQSTTQQTQEFFLKTLSIFAIFVIIFLSFYLGNKYCYNNRDQS